MKVFRDLLRDYRFFWGFWILVMMVAFAGLSFLSPYDPTLWGEVPRDMRPSAEYWLGTDSVSYTHLRAHETVLDLVCRLLLEKTKFALSRPVKSMTRIECESSKSLTHSNA